jgi:hypothetical protein
MQRGGVERCGGVATISGALAVSAYNTGSANAWGGLDDFIQVGTFPTKSSPNGNPHMK